MKKLKHIRNIAAALALSAALTGCLDEGDMPVDDGDVTEGDITEPEAPDGE